MKLIFGVEQSDAKVVIVNGEGGAAGKSVRNFDDKLAPIVGAKVVRPFSGTPDNALCEAPAGKELECTE